MVHSLSVSVLCLAEFFVFLRKTAGWNQGQSGFEHGPMLFHPHAHAILETLSNTIEPHSLLTVKKISETKHTEKSIHSVLTSAIFLMPLPIAPHGSYFPKQQQLVSIITSKSLAFTPCGNIPRYCYVKFLL